MVTLCVVIERARHARRDVLNERSSKSDIEKLRPPADCEQRLSHLARRVYKSYFSFVAKAIHSAEAFVRRLAVKCRVDVLAAGEQKAVDSTHDASCCCCRCEGRNQEWYKPCYLQGSYVSGIEPNTVSTAEPCVSCRSDGYSVGQSQR